MKVGAYQLCTLLSAGEFGTRYSATDTRTDAPVEILLLRDDDTQAESWRAMCKRWQMAALIDSPAARKIEAMEFDAAQPFVAMEWLTEPKLLEYQPNVTALPPKEALDVVCRIALAVSMAQRIGFVHGTISPASIRQRPNDEWVIDFSTAIVPARERPQDHEDSFVAPEAARGDLDPSCDVFALGAVLQWVLLGRVVLNQQDDAGTSKLADALSALTNLRPGVDSLVALLTESNARDPLNRPEIADFAGRLRQVTGQVNASSPPREPRLAITKASIDEISDASRFERTVSSEINVATLATVSLPMDLGRFRLTEKLGQGGMGAVYRGEDLADGSPVAVKVLSGNAADKSMSRRRFAKEARMLARVKSPYVAKLFEFNDERGMDYLVTEFVPGRSLGDLLTQLGVFEEAAALAVMSDVCRGLAAAHGQAIVHRDVKPDNILLTEAGLQRLNGDATSSRSSLPLAKLSDFGLARSQDQTESLAITRQGSVMGTPYYMSPEQCRGGATDARSDVYSMGATLFHLLAGQPPFAADTHVGLMHKHCNEPAPSLSKLKPVIASGLERVIEKSLAKNPDARYANADALLVDLENLRLGQATSLMIHPKMPEHDPAKVFAYEFSWTLTSSPAQLWPFVANTDRLNQAIGLHPATYTTRVDPQLGVRRFAETRVAGQQLAWEEHPYEWIEGRRMSILREFSKGPFDWFVSVVELLPQTGGGTRLIHRIKVQPRNLLGKLVAGFEIGLKASRSLGRAYQQIDGFIAGGKHRDPTADAFRRPASLGARRRNRLQQRLERVRDRDVDPAVLDTLGQYLEYGSDQDVSRIRPKAFAERFALDSAQAIRACLHATREGLLVLLWDILCPSCQIPANVQESLAALESHGHCEACNVDFDLDFANSIEMIFRAHPEIRDVEVRTYCIGGPAFSAHVVAQTRVAPGERFEIEADLPEGAYRLRGPQLPYLVELRTSRTSAIGRWELALSKAPPRDLIPTLKVGSQVITLFNDGPAELLVRLERIAPRHDAVTAAEASSLPLFRELLPDQVLSAGQMVSLATVTLLNIQLDRAADLYAELGDGEAFAVIRAGLVALEAIVVQHGGAVVKFIGEGMLATFNDPLKAAAAALELSRAVEQPGQAHPLRVRAALHAGSAMVTTFNDRLDYFGSTVHAASRLLDLARPGDVMTTSAITSNAEISRLIARRGRQIEVVAGEEVDGVALAGLIVQRFCS